MDGGKELWKIKWTIAGAMKSQYGKPQGAMESLIQSRGSTESKMNDHRDIWKVKWILHELWKFVGSYGNSKNWAKELWKIILSHWRYEKWYGQSEGAMLTQMDNRRELWKVKWTVAEAMESQMNRVRELWRYMNNLWRYKTFNGQSQELWTLEGVIKSRRELWRIKRTVARAWSEIDGRRSNGEVKLTVAGDMKN